MDAVGHRPRPCNAIGPRGAKGLRLKAEKGFNKSMKNPKLHAMKFFS